MNGNYLPLDPSDSQGGLSQPANTTNQYSFKDPEDLLIPNQTLSQPYLRNEFHPPFAAAATCNHDTVQLYQPNFLDSAQSFRPVNNNVDKESSFALKGAVGSMDDGGSDDGLDKSIYPCTDCRTLKRKCDRLIPQCSSCRQRVVTTACTYISAKE